jgi:hypothetical protein
MALEGLRKSTERLDQDMQSPGRYLNRGPYRTRSRYADHSTANFDMTKWKWINACLTINALHAAASSCEATLAGLIKKLPEFHWTRKFITLFTRTITGPCLDLNSVHTFMPCFFRVDVPRRRKYCDMITERNCSLQGYGTVNTRWRHSSTREAISFYTMAGETIYDSWFPRQQTRDATTEELFETVFCIGSAPRLHS